MVITYNCKSLDQQAREGCQTCSWSAEKCVCVFSSHPFWTSSSLDVPAGVTQEEGHTGGRSHRISHPPFFCGSCLNFSHSLPSSTVKSNFVLLLLLLFPHISPISRTRGHRRRLPFPYHRYIQKTQTKEEKERKKITDEKTSPDLIGGEGKK